jgi:hypothetical protein
MIYIEPTGGLANRIRVIANGIWLKKKLNTSLFIIWNENDELYCPFDLLFEPIDDFIIVEKKKQYNYLVRSNQLTAVAKMKAKVKNFALGIDYFIRDEDFPNINVYEIAKKHDRIYMQICQRFTESLAEFKLFKPIPLINEKIKGLFKNFNSNNIIGIQIRGTDHELSKVNSPAELFIKRMEQLIFEDKEVLFFLATDEASIENELKEVFGNRIISYKKELSRQTVNGMQDAVADLFALSNTQLILGSYWSSFSEVAAWIGDKKLEVIKKN